MSVPMSRSITRPFGRPANTSSTGSAPQQTASSSSMPSTTDYVLQDAPDDTPHGIHPHAASYASQPPVAPLQTPNKTKTLREMTHAERVAWAQLAGKTSAYAAAPKSADAAPQAPEVSTSSTSSAPGRYYSAPDAEQPVYTYGNAAEAWGPHNEHLQLKYQPWGQPGALDQATPPASPTASAPSTALPAPLTTGSAPSTPLPGPLATGSAPSHVATPVLGSPIVLDRPARTSSLAYRLSAPAAVTVSSSSSVPELEIVVSRPNGQDVTIRVFHPAPPRM